VEHVDDPGTAASDTSTGAQRWHAPACRCTRACDQDRGPPEHMACFQLPGPRTCRHTVKPAGATRCVVRADAQAQRRRAPIAISSLWPTNLSPDRPRGASRGTTQASTPATRRGDGTAHRTPRPYHAVSPAAVVALRAPCARGRRRSEQTTNRLLRRASRCVVVCWGLQDARGQHVVACRCRGVEP